MAVLLRKKGEGEGRHRSERQWNMANKKNSSREEFAFQTIFATVSLQKLFIK